MASKLLLSMKDYEYVLLELVKEDGFAEEVDALQHASLT
jgi:hypothetical protein